MLIQTTVKDLRAALLQAAVNTRTARDFDPPFQRLTAKVLFTARPSGITLEGVEPASFKVRSIASLPGNVIAPGGVAIDAKGLRAALAKKPAGEAVEIADDGRVTVGPVTYTLPIREAADWIPRSEFKGVVSEGEAAELRTALESVEAAQGKDDPRHYLNGVLFTRRESRGKSGRAGPAKLTITATDGHRLHTIDTDIPWHPKGQWKLKRSKDHFGPAILPRAAVKAVLRALKKAKGTVSIQAKDDQNVTAVSVSGEGWTVEADCMEGCYPGFKHLLPDPVADDRQSSVLATAEVAAAFASMPKADRFRSLAVVDFSDATIAAFAPKGKEPECTVKVGALANAFTYSGRAGLNARYVTDALAAAGGELFGLSIKPEFNSDGKPGDLTTPLLVTSLERPKWRGLVMGYRM